jgi:hypothetical protein
LSYLLLSIDFHITTYFKSGYFIVHSACSCILDVTSIALLGLVASLGVIVIDE